LALKALDMRLSKTPNTPANAAESSSQSENNSSVLFDADANTTNIETHDPSSIKQ
jgi:hypothetical protein